MSRESASEEYAGIRSESSRAPHGRYDRGSESDSRAIACHFWHGYHADVRLVSLREKNQRIDEYDCQEEARKSKTSCVYL